MLEYLLINPLQAPLPIAASGSQALIFRAAAVFATRFIYASRKSPELRPCEWIFNRFAAAGAQLNGDPRIDRDAVFKLKKDALELLWTNFLGDDRFDRFCREQGAPLAQFGIIQRTLRASRHGLASMARGISRS